MRGASLFVLWALDVISIVTVHGQEQTCVNQSAINLDDDLPYVRARFPDIQIKAPTRWPLLGGRNQTYCCIQAVDTYLRNNCTNAGQVRISRRILDPDVQFPCGASWNGDTSGAPEVEAAYDWTGSHCTGWQVSQGAAVREWAQLLVSFILPSVVFSFNIPRPRKLKVGEGIFHTYDSRWRYVARFFGLGLAALSVVCDTVIWLMVSFAFAGPLLLSGLYEAQLDKRVLNHLRKQIKDDKLPLALRARILFTILCGNLDLNPAWRHTMDLANDLDTIDRASRRFRRVPVPILQVQMADASNGNEASSMMEAVTRVSDRFSSEGYEDHDGLLSNNDQSADIAISGRPFNEGGNQSQLTVFPYNGGFSTSSVSEANSVHGTALSNVATENETAPLLNSDNQNKDDSPSGSSEPIKEAMARLKAMLSCQYSFGTTIGGPIVFFVGSFIYALLEIRQDLGNEDVAEALAFGMWWTIIPHIAAVAGLLLAGNNPNILAGIVSAHNTRYQVGENLFQEQVGGSAPGSGDPEPPPAEGEQTEKLYMKYMEKVYEADYMPAWMWDRGRCKQDWLLVLFTDSWLKYRYNDRLPTEIREGLETFLTEVIMLDLRDWIWLWLFAFLLMLIPCAFSFSTAFFTPAVGIGCRAMTFLSYAVGQTILFLAWAYYLTYRDSYWATARKVKRILRQPIHLQDDPELQRLIKKLRAQTIRDTRTPAVQGAGPDLVVEMDQDHPLSKVLFYVCCVVGFAISCSASMGGTSAQLIGFYRVNFCLMTVQNWPSSKSARTFVTLSSNTADEILEARRHWLIIGYFSVVLLGSVCILGWWYQKRRRAVFKQVAGHLDGYERHSYPLHDLHAMP